jgi:glycosyltransferase involved in cell wall biosynthesis
MFARLADLPDFRLRVLHGRSIAGTKLQNGNNLEGFDHEELPTLSIRIRSSGREALLLFAPTVFASLRRFKPDVILAEGGSNVATNLVVYAYAALFSVPVVWWTLGMLPNRRFGGIGRIYRALVKGMERRSAALLGYSSVALGYFSEMGYPRERAFRAVNCVDTERIIAGLPQDKEQAEKIRARMRLDGRFVVLCVGALTQAKSIDRLLEAFASLLKSHKDGFLIVVGDGPDRARLERRATELGIGDDVAFVGEVVEGVGAYYEAADVFVLPGLGGLAVSEAMTHSLPVVCARGDGCEVDLVLNDRTGYRVETDDDKEAQDQIAAALDRLASDSKLRKRLGAAARDMIDTTYNVGSYIENVAEAVRYAHRSAPR